MKEQKYYSLELDEAEKEADLIIFGDITSYVQNRSNVSAYNLSMKLATLEADTINVHINSCGGEVAEGLAIYNRLKQHKAKIKTYCDGFACSIASVIFMAGDERVMSNASTLMIHNPWTWISGNAAELRKTENMDKLAQASVNAYLGSVTLSEEEIKKLMDEETWILPDEARVWLCHSSDRRKSPGEIQSVCQKDHLTKTDRKASVGCSLAPKIDEPKENNLLKMFANIKEI